ncbi:sulfur carrier protein [Nocardioides sp. J9]|uniref:sulfur carrier protein ThiS n=1 Tax=Nocardioides sp. J9 TaxID=935844 RepID=UPI0011A91848|nr:sulfur carrier protein ThiS [Nocardioides sp. J9]TWG94633.1 sulfur carrier protein [Nocardioides sp. J9]
MITLNGEPVAAIGSVADLLGRRLGYPAPSGVAVALNGEVLPRAQWPATPLADGDVVEVVTAVQGG